MAWNPEYLDMFAAAFGSFDFQRQGSGLVACFSLKNPGHPEYLFTTPSGCPPSHLLVQSRLAGVMPDARRSSSQDDLVIFLGRPWPCSELVLG